LSPPALDMEKLMALAEKYKVGPLREITLLCRITP
jgi:hypothetical protein